MQAADYRAILTPSRQPDPPHQGQQNLQQITRFTAQRHWAGVAGAPIMITKLTCPPPPAGLVARPELIHRLDQSRACRLVLLCAPAGYGKTTLLSAWARQSASPVAWVSLDVDDSRPARFWDCVGAAIEIVQSGNGAPAHVARAPTGSVAQLQAWLINSLAQLPPTTLILDNYQAIDDEDLHLSLAAFIDHLPPTLHVIIASRARPPLPLMRWRIASWLDELGVAELQFGLTEAGSLVEQSSGRPLGLDSIAELNERAEGWAAGLCLAAQGARSGPEPGERAFGISGGLRDVQDYLEDEVLGPIPQEMQTFLLRTAVADRLCAPLCTELCLPAEPTEPTDGAPALDIAGAHALLAQAERAGLFLIPLDAERRWYRYHRLFADALRYRLEQADPTLAAALRARAAAWLAKHPPEHDRQPAERAQTVASELTLSQRELDVLRLLIDGHSNQEIANMLIIGVNTVKMHIKHIYDKLDAHSRVQAATQARRLGLIT